MAKAEVQIGTAKVPATFDLAIERFKAAVTADGKFLPARRALANRYRVSDQPGLAAAQYRAIAEVEPEREENFFDLGRYLWSLGRKEDAYDAYVLEAALVRRAPLLTLDKRLARAAEQAGVATLEV